jgi:hypothetical protein
MPRRREEDMVSLTLEIEEPAPPITETVAEQPSEKEDAWVAARVVPQEQYLFSDDDFANHEPEQPDYSDTITPFAQREPEEDLGIPAFMRKRMKRT